MPYERLGVAKDRRNARARGTTHEHYDEEHEADGGVDAASLAAGAFGHGEEAKERPRQHGREAEYLLEDDLRGRV